MKEDYAKAAAALLYRRLLAFEPGCVPHELTVVLLHAKGEPEAWQIIGFEERKPARGGDRVGLHAL